MKNILAAATGLIISTTILFSQDFSREFGKIGKEEMDLNKYSKDPSADAVVLFDIGDTRFADDGDYGYNIEFTRARRIKIFTRGGISNAEVEIPFYVDANGKAETVNSIEAYSYNQENGQIFRTKLDPLTVYSEKMSDRWSNKKFVIPNVKPGSVIEYKYVLESPFLFSLPSWKFQDHIPTIYSKYVARIIPFYEYAFIMQGAAKFDSKSSIADPEKRTWGALQNVNGTLVGDGVQFQDLVNTFVMKDVPAFKDEAYITSDEDYIIKIDFQESTFTSPRGTKTEIISTWPKLVQEMIKYDDFGKYLKSCDKPARKILETEIDTAGKSKEEKCRAIINYVKNSFKWNESGSIYSSKAQKDFIKQKTGNTADINLFLTALLKAAGVDASPVIISTRDHGKILSNYPFLHYFNYVIVLVNLNNQKFLCDGTEFYTDYNRIPSRCINDKGLIISEGEVTWLDLNLNYKSIDSKTVRMEISPETQKVKARIVLQAAELDAYWYKKTFQDDSLKLKKHFNDMGLPVISRLSTQNFDKNEFPYTISFEGEAEIEQLNDKLIISPYLDFYMKENKLKQPVRTYPVDFIYANTEKYSCKIIIPDNYKVLTLPEGLSMDNETARIKVNYDVSDNTINIESEYSFKKAVNPPSEYLNIRNDFDIIVRKFHEQIVLVKK